MASVVGLDIGAHRVRLVEAEGGAKGLRILRLGERELGTLPEGGDREAAVAEAVRALLQEFGARGEDVVLSWPAEACILREISVPFREDDQIRKVAKFEFEHHVHSVAIEDVVVDYVRIAETRDGARLLGLAAPKEPLRARLRALDGVRVDPLAVDVDVTALFGAAHATGVLAQHPSCILVDVGARSTKVILVVDGSLRTARALRGGTDALTHLLEDDLGVDAATAASRSLEGGARSDDLMAVPAARPSDLAPAERSAASLEVAVVEDRRTDFLDRLCREVTRTLATAAPGLTFSAVLVTGRGSLLPGVRERLGHRLDLPVYPLDILAGVQHPVPPETVDEANATYAVALGAAARGLRASPLQIDLRREDLAFARRFDQVKGAVAVALALLLVAVGFHLWGATQGKTHWELQFGTALAELRKSRDDVEKRFERELSRERQDLLKRMPARTEDVLQEVNESRRRATYMESALRNELGLSTEVPPIISSLEVMRKVHAAISGVREKIEYCLVLSEQYTQKEAKITLLLSDRTHADVIKAALDALTKGENAIFTSVDYGNISARKDNRWDPTFTCTLAKGTSE